MGIVRWFGSAMTVAAVAALVALVGQAGGPVQAGALNVDQGDAGCSDVAGTPYCTIGGALTNATPGDTINVFPGTYAESVDLSTMGTPGDISLFSVDAVGTPTASTVAIESPAEAAIQTSAGAFPGAVTIDGFTVSSPDDSGIFLHAGAPVTVRNVTANDNEGDGILIRGNNNPASVSDSVLNGNLGDGLNIFDSNAPATITGVTANANNEDGMELNVTGAVSISGSTTTGNLGIGFGGNGVNTATEGPLTITNSTANSNASDGFEGHGASSISVSGSEADGNGNDGMQLESHGDLTIDSSSAEGNGDDGYQLNVAGDVDITDTHAAENDDDGVEIGASGDIELRNSGSHDNGERGFNLDLDGALTFERSAANGNGDDGLNFDLLAGDVDDGTVAHSIFIANGAEAIDYPSNFGTVSERAANGNIVCLNGAGFDVDGPSTVNIEGNWWGSASGPTHPSNPGGTGDEIFDAGNGSSGTGDFTPWIDTISATNGPATQGQPKVITFEFTGGGGSVALTDGPGDPSGPPVFAAATDNGTVETTGFIENGVLEVVLTADAPGTATVTVNGPCGLGDSVGGNSVELQVIEGQLVAWGDDDCNGAVNAVDGLKNLQDLAGIPYQQEDPCFVLGEPVSVSLAGAAQQLLWGDVDCDGDVDSVDALGILRSVAALPVNQEPNCPEVGEDVLVAE